MAKEKQKKPPQPRAEKYDAKLAVKGDFIDVFKVVKKHKEDKKKS